MKKLLVCFVLLVAGVMGLSAQDFPPDVVARALEIDLGADFITAAELTYPAEGDGPFPTVILVHGSGPYDMDATYFTDPTAEPLSANFRLLAETLPQEGIAVLRYNKRGVLADGGYDYAQVQAATLDQLVADLQAVLAVATAQPEVGPVYLYGWSEGAWVVTNVASAAPESVSGLILQAGPDGDLAHGLVYQWQETALPYLLETYGESMTLDDVATIPAGPVSYMASGMFYDPTSTLENPVLNTWVDANGDGVITLDTELRTAINTYVSNYGAFQPVMNASHETAELVAAWDGPVLALHGTLDGWVPLADAERIAVAENVTLYTYEGLGHALSPVESVVTDAFGVMDPAPIADLVAWIEAQ